MESPYQQMPNSYPQTPGSYQQTPGSYQPLYPLSPQPDPIVIYKKHIRRTIMLIVLALATFYAINIFVTFVVGFGALILSGALERLISLSRDLSLSAQELTQDLLLESFPVGLASIAGIIAGSFALLIARGTRLFTEDLTRVNQRISIVDLMKMMGLILGFNAIVSLAPLLLDMFLQIINVSPGEAETDFFVAYMNLPGLLYVVILGPIFEEIMFRGAILRSLQPYGSNFAIVMSSLLFGAYHLVLSQGVFAFFVGLMLAYCTLRFSIKWSMLLHVVNNAIAMAITYAHAGLFIEIGIYFIFLVLALIAGVLGFRQFREQLRVGKPTAIAFATGITPAWPGQSGQAPGQTGQAAWPGPEQLEQARAVAPARPFALAFTSAWLIVALSLAFIISTLTLFVM
jgi:membrane protease YdiL (CAAX protease family)